MDNGMILFGQEITGTSDFKVVKVIETVYQIMYEVAYHPISLAAKQAKIYKMLMEWVDEHHPGWGIQNFIDLSNKDAAEINNKQMDKILTGPLELMYKPQLLVSWGMYVMLQYGVSHIQRRIQVNQIEDKSSNHLLGSE